MLIRSQTIAGQASTLAQASAERARRIAEEACERLRNEGRSEAERAAQARIAAAEARAKTAEEQADVRIAAIRAEAEQQLGTAAAALGRALDGLATLERQVIASAEAETVRLALAVANRVLAREVESDPQWMRGLLSAALSEVPDRRQVVIRCAPRDAGVIRDNLASTVAAVPGTERLHLEEDPALQPGSLVLVSGGTRLDASVASSWERVARSMLDAVPRPVNAMRDDGSIPEAQS
jgi:flagellar assembly protein FliH